MNKTISVVHNEGPMNGFPVLGIDKAKLLAYFDKAIAMDITYGMGHKDGENDSDHKVGTFPPDYRSIDCSGIVRAALAYSTNGQTLALDFPDGTMVQNPWLGDRKFKRHRITTPAEYMKIAGVADGRVRLAFHRQRGRKGSSPSGGDKTGHVFFLVTRNGRVYSAESCGGQGPAYRPFDHDWFVQQTDDIYVLTD